MTFNNQTNSSTEVSHTPSCILSSTIIVHLRVAFYISTFVAAVIVNSLVILIVCKFCRIRGTINYLIINMALSDMFAPSFAIPRIVADIYHPDWMVKGPFGEFLCKLSSFAMDMPAAVSIQTLVLMTVDRFHAIVFPLKHKLLTKRKCIIAIASTWIVACFLYSPYFYTWHLKKWSDRIEFCGSRVDPGYNKEAYFWVLLSLHTVIPLFVLAVLHSLIIVSLKRQEIVNTGTKDQMRRRKENRQIWKMLTSIFLSCLISFVPYHTQMLIKRFNKDRSITSSCSFKIFRIIAYILLYSYSAANPCIYFTFIAKYRQALKRLVSRLLQKEIVSDNESAFSMGLYSHSRNQDF